MKRFIINLDLPDGTYFCDICKTKKEMLESLEKLFNSEWADEDGCAWLNELCFLVDYDFLEEDEDGDYVLKNSLLDYDDDEEEDI